MVKRKESQFCLIVFFAVLAFFKVQIEAKPIRKKNFDIVVLMATPGGIAAAVSASRMGMKVALVERTSHPGGLPANGLGATDIHTRGLASGFFKEFVDRVNDKYIKRFSIQSQQVKDASDGFYFEPHVGEEVFREILRAEENITLFKNYQFDAIKENVLFENNLPSQICIFKVGKPKKRTWLQASIFIDGSYEGDLAAAFGCRFRTYRESKVEFGEPMASKIYKIWGRDSLQEGSTGEADSAIQAFNYRICLTNNPKNRVEIKKPQSYNRADFISLISDVETGFVSGFFPKNGKTAAVVNPVKLPNLKFDANNHHRALLSTDLPEENWPWPIASWTWRDQFAKRLRDYNLGLLYFAQTDSALNSDFRNEARNYGLAKDEYKDNKNFPRQVYVREGRRIEGKHIFVASDALPEKEGKRPPVHRHSIATSHYAIDSHAMYKRETGKKTLDGFISYKTKPFTIPFEVIVPIEIDNILTPVPVSASHVGYGCLRMEPCWMSLGQVAGIAASLAIKYKTTTQKLAIDSVQKYLVGQKINLIFFEDVPPQHPDFELVQMTGLNGWLPEFSARLNETVSTEDLNFWSQKTGFSIKELSEVFKKKTRRDGLVLLLKLWKQTFSEKKP